MKILKNMLSLTLVVALIVLSSFSVFAAINENGDYIGVKTTKTTLKVGETLEAYVYAYNKSGDTVISTGTADIGLQFDNAGFKVKEVKYVTSVGETVTPKATEVQYLINGITSPVTFAESNKILLVEFEAIAEGTYDFSVREESGIGAVIYWSLAEYDEDGELLPAVSVTVTAAQQEEVFEPTYEGVKAADGSVTEGFASGSKVATVFAKATGDLAAGTYGIVFGGQKYVGAADVKDGKYWVIRLYDPSGNILTGASYTCQKFVGDAYETVDYELENN